jgi:hypothetical protein
MKPETSYTRLAVAVATTLKHLKPEIGNDYRASDDPDDNTPGMQITLGVSFNDDKTVSSWNIQTGDNSYTGGAYGHPYWGVSSLYRRSNSREIADDLVTQAVDQLY